MSVINVYESFSSDVVAKTIEVANLSNEIKELHENDAITCVYLDDWGGIVARDIWNDTHRVE